MICTLYAQGELKKHGIKNRKGIFVLPRYEELPLLFRPDAASPWQLPEGEYTKGESMEEAASRILGEAVGMAEFSVLPLCEVALQSDKNEKPQGFVCYLADVRRLEEPDETLCRVFSRMPLGGEMKYGALIGGLRRYAGEFFDERLTDCITVPHAAPKNGSEEEFGTRAD